MVSRLGVGLPIGACAAVAIAVASAALASPERSPRSAERTVERVVVVHHEPPADAPILGPRFAPVTIELFFDPEDHRSAGLHENLARLQARHPRRLRLVYRVVSRTSRPRVTDALAAAREAHAQGRFGEFLEAYFEGSRQRPRRLALPEIAESAGLDLARLNEALASNRHQEAIFRDHYHGRRYRVRGIPGILVNGTPHGARELANLDALEAVYAEGHDRARRLLADGVPLSLLYERLLAEVVASQPVPDIGVGTVDGLARGEQPPAAPPPLLGGAVDTGGPHTRGPEDARVVLVFYCSLQSRNCKQQSDTIEELRAAYPDELRVVFKHLFDEEDQAQPQARRLHEASLCADEQGAFWDFYDRIYSRHVRRLDDDYILRQLEGLDTVDVERLTECMDAGRHAEAVEDHLVGAHRLGVTLTPSVVLGGRLYIGVHTFDELRSLIDLELAPGILERLVPVRAAR
jgi:protein-disulfide isomerase